MFDPILSVNLSLYLSFLCRSYIDLKEITLLNMTAVFSCWLFFLLFSPAVPMCLPTDFTLYAEKPECDFCVAINTTICMGFCYSRVCMSFVIIKKRQKKI